MNDYACSRLRNYRSSSCNCDNSKADTSGTQSLELSENMKTYSEVYDNPNYSHIMIGGQPFFILPSGELSEHVPVPRVTETVRVVRQGGEPGREQQSVLGKEPGK